MKKAIFTLLCLLPAFTCQARTIIVDANGSGEYPTIQDAIDDSNDGDVVILTPGTYTGQGNSDIDFNGLAITLRSESGPENCIIDCQGSISDPHRGFYFHSGEDENSVLSGFTIKNGSVEGGGGWLRGGSGILCYSSSPTISNCIITDNTTYSQTVTGQSYGGGIYLDESNATITNCTISNNSADVGGGIYCWKNSSPTLTNCTFSGNSAEVCGGGMWNKENSNPTLTNCTFSGNSARWDGGGMNNHESSPMLTNCTFIGNSAFVGGGMANFSGSSPTLTDCTFSGNSAGWSGGGMANFGGSSPALANCTFTSNSAGSGGGMQNWGYGSPTLTDCTFSGNSAGWDGGGMNNHEGSPMLTNCTFIGNSAEKAGGGMGNWYSNPTLTNCTFAENYAANGNALACDSRGQHPRNLQLTNCILWDGGNEIYNNDGSTIDITYSDIQNSWPGTGNIDVDPCFVAPGCWADANDPNIIIEPNDPNAIWIEGDYHLYPFSLCINAGDPNYLPEPNETDLDGNPRVIAGRIDMGAYESNHTRARLWIFPRLIYRYSQRQRRILAWLRLPKGVTKDQIDSNTPLTLYPGEIEPTRQYIFPRGRRGPKRVSIIAYFDKSDLMDVISNNGRVELKLVGRLKTGRYFYGSDTIRIINRRPPPRPWHRRHNR